MNESIRGVLQSKGVIQTAITGFGNYSAAFLSAIAIILISRSLEPTLFGEFSAAFSLAMLLAKLNDAGLTIASQKFASKSQNKQEVKSFIYLGYKYKMYISITLLLVFLPLSPLLTSIFKFSNPFIVPISVSLGLLLVYYDQLVASLLATHSFLRASLVNLSQAGFKLLTAGALTFFLQKSLLPLIITFIGAPGIPVLFTKFFEPKWFQRVTVVPLIDAKKTKYINLAKHSALLVFILGVIDSIGVLFVKSFLDSYEAGLLGGISRIALLFTLIGVSLSQVLNNRVSRYTIKSDINAFIKKSLFLSVGMIFLWLATMPFLPLIINITIGPDYLVAKPALTVLLASVFMYIISVPFSALFFAFDNTKYFSLSGLIQLIAIVFGNYLLVPSYGIIGSAFAQLFSRLLLLIFTLCFAYYTYKNQFYYNEK